MPVESSAQLPHGFVQLPKLVGKQPGLVAHIMLPVVQPVEVHNEQRRFPAAQGQGGFQHRAVHGLPWARQGEHRRLFQGEGRAVRLHQHRARHGQQRSTPGMMIPAAPYAMLRRPEAGEHGGHAGLRQGRKGSPRPVAAEAFFDGGQRGTPVQGVTQPVYVDDHHPPECQRGQGQIMHLGNFMAGTRKKRAAVCAPAWHAVSLRHHASGTLGRSNQGVTTRMKVPHFPCFSVVL